jgi:Uri superfamily endonuclease
VTGALGAQRAVVARASANAASVPPPEPGTYALVLECPRSCAVTVGRLGHCRFPEGYYVYVGSALGAGGLRARILHHLLAARKPWWHIDYLRAHMIPVEVWYRISRMRQEDLWASALREAADGWIERFGNSDCRCSSHLFHFLRRPDLRRLLCGTLAVFRPGGQPRTR